MLDILGEGAYAKVYLVEGAENARYALKMIAINKQSKERISDEGRLLATMKHPNILWAR